MIVFYDVLTKGVLQCINNTTYIDLYRSGLFRSDLNDKVSSDQITIIIKNQNSPQNSIPSVARKLQLERCVRLATRAHRSLLLHERAVIVYPDGQPSLSRDVALSLFLLRGLSYSHAVRWTRRAFSAQAQTIVSAPTLSTLETLVEQRSLWLAKIISDCFSRLHDNPFQHLTK